MSRVLSFVRLDFITVKPYLTLKNLFILLLVVTVLSINKTSSGFLIGMIMAFAFMYSSYPFAVGEQNGIDQLYITLPMSKRNIVLGRYGFVLAIDVMSGAAAFVLLFASQNILQRAFSVQETLLTILVLFFVYTFFQAIQLPVYFKLGYARAKFLVYLPIAIIPLAAVAIGSRFSDAYLELLAENVLAWFFDNPFFATVIVVIIWIAIMSVSYSISFNSYKKREF